MHHADLAVLITRLDEWTDTEENLARLVDLMHYWLGSEYAGWVTDPNDPEVIRARAERKRSGIKPPSEPLVTPVARRPVAAQMDAVRRLNEQIHRVAPHLAEPVEQPQAPAPAAGERKKITLKELRALRDQAQQ